MLFPGEEIHLKVLRESELLEMRVPVQPLAACYPPPTLTLSSQPHPPMQVQPLRRLVPATNYDEPQPYFLYGGFAFVGLTEPYLHEWGDEWQADAPQDLVHLANTGIQERMRSGHRTMNLWPHPSLAPARIPLAALPAR